MRRQRFEGLKAREINIRSILTNACLRTHPQDVREERTSTWPELDNAYFRRLALRSPLSHIPDSKELSVDWHQLHRGLFARI